MRSERRVFRPFDIPASLGTFLDEARLLIGGEAEEFVEAGARRRVDPVELGGRFAIELARDDATFSAARDEALEAARSYGDDAVEFVTIVSSAYLKFAQPILRQPLAAVGRVVALNGSGARAFGAVHHGCDVELYLSLGRAIESETLRPHRKATWLARARFELRTGLDGVGFNLMPLTDDVRHDLRLSHQTMRYVLLDESPLDASPSTTITVYVDSMLLERLRRSPRKSWAKAFTDQLAVDVLASIAMRALADEEIHQASWSAVSDSLLGSLILMIAGRPSSNQADAAAEYERLLDVLRGEPLRFLALIEGACEMRDAAGLIAGAGT